jgi:prepilin-type N-terminal cleavage/methylation domain-containing protein
MNPDSLSLRPQPSHRKSFTLVELLTVMAVVAILASLLVPSFISARSKARAALCVSNQRQVSVAYTTKENNDKNRLFRYTDSFNAFWPVLKPYGISIDTNFCPETQKSRPLELMNQYSTLGNVSWPWASSSKTVLGSYFFNGWVFDVSLPPSGDPNDWNGNDPTSFFGTRLGQITECASVPLACDGVWVDGWPKFGTSIPPRSQWEKNDPTQDNGLCWGEPDYGRITVNRHEEKEAVGYIDGHAGLVKIVDIPKLKWSANHPTTQLN